MFAYTDLDQICDGGRKEVLTILFRHATVLPQEIEKDTLTANSLLERPYQSITKMPPRFTQWLQNQI